jgi:sugar (pentulose or hexulose) kinase
MQCLGLDLGSSSIKGAVLDLDQRQVVSVIREPFPAPVSGLPAKHFEVDPQAITEGVRKVLAQLIEIAPEAKAVFFCGQMGGIILVGPHGQPVTNYLSWRDQRTLAPHQTGGSYLDQIQRLWSNGEFSDLGNELKPGSATSLLFWLNENGQLPKGAIPATIGDYVIGQLCGVLPRMEPTQAIGLLNLQDGDWHHAAFSKLGIDSLNWLPLADAQTAVGEFSIHGRRLPCFPTLGDQQCALRGAGLQEDELSLNISTGSQVSQIAREVIPGNYQTRRFFHGRYLNTITHLPAGRSLNVLFDLLTELSRAEGISVPNAWSYIARSAAEATGDGLNCDLAFFSGPMGETGSIDQITVDNLTIGNLFHAAFRNMAETFQICSERLSPERTWQRVALSGGLTQAVPVLRRLIEARFDAPIRESVEQEETLTGLLRLAETVRLV